jgi:hypothetical protein
VLAQKFIDAVDQLNADLNIPTHLDALQEADIPALAKAACFEAHTGYPVPRYMSQAQVCEEPDSTSALPPRRRRTHASSKRRAVMSQRQRPSAIEGVNSWQDSYTVQHYTAEHECKVVLSFI